MSKRLNGYIDIDTLIEAGKVIVRSDGRHVAYLNIWERQEPSSKGYTHYAECKPKKEDRKEGANYYCGNFKLEEIEETPQQVVQNASELFGDNKEPF